MDADRTFFLVLYAFIVMCLAIMAGLYYAVV